MLLQRSFVLEARLCANSRIEHGLAALVRGCAGVKSEAPL